MAKRANLGIYMRTLSQVIDTTEQMGERLNPYFEDVKAQTQGQKELTAEDFATIQKKFHDGVVLYEANAKGLAEVQAPIQVIGMHKLLVAAYRDFYQGCVQMDASLDYQTHSVAQATFEAAEDQQTQAMDKVSSQVQRILRKLM